MSSYHAVSTLTGVLSIVMCGVLATLSWMALRSLRAHLASEAALAARGASIVRAFANCSLATLLRGTMLCCCVNATWGMLWTIVTAWLRITVEDGFVLAKANPLQPPPSHADLTEAGRWCMVGAKLSPSSYLATKAWTYLFFLLKARTVVTSQKGMGMLQRLILGFICTMLFGAALAVWLIGADRSKLDSTCIFDVPAWSVILMAVADAMLSAVTLYLFIQPLRETIRANRQLHQAQMHALAKHNSLGSYVPSSSPSHSHHPALIHPSTPSHFQGSPTTPSHAMHQRSSLAPGASFKIAPAPMPSASPRREAFMAPAASPPANGDATAPPPPSASPRKTPPPFPISTPPPPLPTGLSVYSSHFSGMRSTEEMTLSSDDSLATETNPTSSSVGGMESSGGGSGGSGAPGSLPVSPKARPLRTTTVERLVVAPRSASPVHIGLGSGSPTAAAAAAASTAVTFAADRSIPSSPTAAAASSAFPAVPPSSPVAVSVGGGGIGERGFDRGHALEQVMRKNAISCVVAVLVTILSLGEIVVASLTHDDVALKFMWLCGNFDLMVTCVAIFHLMHSSGSERTQQAQLMGGALYGQAAAMAVAAASGQSAATQQLLQLQAQGTATTMLTTTSSPALPERRASPGVVGGGDATHRSRTTAGGALHSARSRGENDRVARKYQSHSSVSRPTQFEPIRAGHGAGGDHSGLTDAGPGFGVAVHIDTDRSTPIPILAHHMGHHTSRTAAAAASAAAGTNGRTPRSHRRGKSFGGAGAGALGGGGDIPSVAGGRPHGHRRDLSASQSEMERLGSIGGSVFSSFASPHRNSGGGIGGGGGVGTLVGSGNMLTTIADGVEPTTPSTAGASAGGSARPAASVAGQHSSAHSSARPPLVIAVTSSSGRTDHPDSTASAAAAALSDSSMPLPGSLAEDAASDLEALASGS